MKLKATFICAKHEEYGSLGWKMANRPWTDPLTGMAIPHDIMEHTAHENGTVEDELKALGASIHVRDKERFYVESGKYHTNPAHHIAADIPLLMGHYLGDRELLTPLKTKANNDIDDIITDLFAELDKYDGEDLKPLTSEQKDSIRGWVRLGYLNSIKRYKGINSYILCSAFIEATQQAEKWEELEGSQMSIHIEVTSAGHHVYSEERYI